ncbi:hypothetical protein ACQ4PT_067074 [Festuca glaucescens]
MAQALVQRACAKLRSAIGDEAVLRLNFTSDLQEVLVALEVLQTVMEKTEMQLTRPSPAPVWFQEMTRMLPRLAIKKNDVANKVEEMKEKVIGLKKTFQSYIYEGPVLIQHQQLRRAGDKPRSMLLFEPLVLGRRADKQKIVNMLLSAASNITKGRPRSIILPIFGFATSGMTTMAMMVFSDTHSFTQQYDFRVWASTAAEANPSKRLAAKLSATAKALTSWNDRFIGNVKLQILVANELILRLDVAMESRALSRGERGLRKLLKGKLLGLASLERTIARQRSRITWLSEGDACTRFFHLHANHRRRKNFITHFKVDGSLVADQEGKAKAADAFYEQLLGPSPDRGFSLDLDYLGMQSHDLVELDAPFSEEECTARRLNALKSPALMFKLDITKAFDTVDWAFLLQIMIKLGFGPRWTVMVVGLLSTASTRVLVNGAAGDLIYNRRGLRQGDPLSPLLFDLVMEVLHLLLQKATSEGLLSRLAPRGLLHRTSMYADDVVTFIKPERADLLACAAVVEDFGEASGLRTNRTKCSLHPIRCTVEQVELAQSILQCSVEGWPCKYLSLPLGLRKVTATQLQPVVERAASRLPLWSAWLLNRGGRTILVQTTLSAIPVHAMMSLDIPPKTMQALRKICRGFMWKARADVSGGHCLVPWTR